MNTEETVITPSESAGAAKQPTNPSAQLAARAKSVLAVAVALFSRRDFCFGVLVLFAACYFGSYYRYGISFRDEGGTVAVLAKRLLEGQRPFLDVELGYNVMWFYPVVGLFKVFGVSFILLRAYCFFLSTITAVLGFFTVDRVSRRPWAGLLAGMLLVLVPGMTFKNYVPLVTVANIFCLVHFVLAGIPRRATGAVVQSAAEGVAPATPSVTARWGWIVIGAAVLGFTLQVRVDIGMFVTLLWMGVFILCALDSAVPRRARMTQLIGGPLLLLLVAGAVHLPVVIDAKRRGYLEPFAAQYYRWPKSIAVAFAERFGSKPDAPAPRVPAPPPSAALDQNAKPLAPVTESSEGNHTVNRGILRRLGIGDIFHGKTPNAKLLALLLYAPLLTLLPLVLWALLRFRTAWQKGEHESLCRALAALVAVGGALTAFPQYFFFRPDAPHLSEFSPGFWVATVTATLLLGLASEGKRFPLNWAGTALFAVILAHSAIYLYRMIPDRSTGTIASRRTLFVHKKRPPKMPLFHGANGVDVYVSQTELEELNKLADVIRTHSSPGDYLLVYPYHPAINLMMDLPTYEIDLYVDNATHSKTWESGAITRMEKYQPAVIVLSDWEINDTPESRFSVWAPHTKAWIQAHYDFQGLYMGTQEIEVYTRKPSPTAAAAAAAPVGAQ